MTVRNWQNQRQSSVILKDFLEALKRSNSVTHRSSTKQRCVSKREIYTANAQRLSVPTDKTHCWVKNDLLLYTNIKKGGLNEPFNMTNSFSVYCLKQCPSVCMIYSTSQLFHCRMFTLKARLHTSTDVQQGEHTDRSATVVLRQVSQGEVNPEMFSG